MTKYLLITILFLTQPLALTTYAAEPTDPQCIKELVNSDTDSDSDEVNTNSDANTVAESAASMQKTKTDIHQVYSKFKAYFEAVNETTLERDQVVYISQLALFAKEHVLLMGPPGTAKSQLAESILKAIKADKGNGYETSYYKIQMTPETTLSETHGPINYNELNQTGRQVRFYDEGMLKSHGVFIDEIFDSRANAKRNILGLINEREHAQGPNIEGGHIHTVIAATNKYLSEVYEEAGNDGPKALVDRFAFSVFIPGGLEYTGSILQIIKKAGKTKTTLPDLTYDDINLLREQINNIEIPDHVALFLELLSNNLKIQTEALEQASLKEYLEKKADGEHPAPPYRATKYHSARTTGKAAGILKAIVLLNWLESGGTRSLTVSLEDIKKLEVFYTLNGPSDEFLDETLSLTTNDHEKRQLMNIKQERKIFRKLYQKFADEINDNIVQFALTDLQTEMADDNLSEEEKQELAKKLSALAIQSHISPTEMLRKNAISPKFIAKILAHSFATDALEELVGKDQAETSLNTAIAELEKAKEAALVKKQEFERQVQEKVYELALEKAKLQLINSKLSEREASEQLNWVERADYPRNEIYNDSRYTHVYNPQQIKDTFYFITRSKFYENHYRKGSFIFAIDQNDKIKINDELNDFFTKSKRIAPIAIGENDTVIAKNGTEFLDTYDFNGKEIDTKILSKQENENNYTIYEPKHKNIYFYNDLEKTFTILQENGNKQAYKLDDSSKFHFSANFIDGESQFYAGKDPNIVFFKLKGEDSFYKITFSNDTYVVKPTMLGIGTNHKQQTLNQNFIKDDILYKIQFNDTDLLLDSFDLNNEVRQSIKLTELSNALINDIDLSSDLSLYNFWYNPETARISFILHSKSYVYDTIANQFVVYKYPVAEGDFQNPTDTFIEYRPNKFVRFVIDEQQQKLVLDRFDMNEDSGPLDTSELEALAHDLIKNDSQSLRDKAIKILNDEVLTSGETASTSEDSSKQNISLNSQDKNASNTNNN